MENSQKEELSLFVVFELEEQQVTHPSLGYPKRQENNTDMPLIHLHSTVNLILFCVFKRLQSRIDDLTPTTNEGCSHFGVI